MNLALTPTQALSGDHLASDNPDARDAVFEFYTIRTRKAVMIAGQWVEADMILTRDETGFHERPAGKELP